MGKNKKKQNQNIPLVPTSQSKKAKRNKAKKLKKNLQGTNPVISSIPSLRVNESKKSKKRRFLKEQQLKASALPTSTVNAKTKKQVTFGEASSESDSEPIEADWQNTDDQSDSSNEQWQNKENVTKSFSNSDDDSNNEQSDSGSSNNDLEESEEDEDEELSEDDLNTLIQSQKKSAAKDASKQQINDPKKKPLKRTHESVENTLPSTKKMKLAGESKQSIVKTPDKCDDQVSVSYSWTNESVILEEIKRRATELSSATLYVTPLPSNCNESMLKSLSPTMMSYRLSIKNKKKQQRNFVFLQYIDADTAETARKAITGRLFAGKTISAQPNRLSFPISDIKSDNINRKELFVTGFNSSTTKNDLMRIFPKGTVDFKLTKDGTSCGYAIVKFVNENVSIEAFSTTHKRLVRGLPIFVNFILKLSSQSKKIDDKQTSKNQLKVNNTSDNNNNKTSKTIEQKMSNKLSSTEKTSNIVVHKTTIGDTTKSTTSNDNNNDKSNKTHVLGKTKVLVEQLPPETDEKSESSASESNDDDDDDSEADELLVNQMKTKNPITDKTSVLNDLVSSKTLKVSGAGELDEDDDGEEEEDDDDVDDDDDEDEDEISEYDEDDSGGEEEDDDDDDDDDSEDDDDDDDDDEDDIDEEDLGDTNEDSDEVANENVINKKASKQTKIVDSKPLGVKNNHSPLNLPSSSDDEEQGSSDDSDNQSDEEVDKQLMAVIQAKRNAKKSFKPLSNAKRNFNANPNNSNNKNNSTKHSGKMSSSQWLRVPQTMKMKKK
ncbi:unnamed protein product [Schistosoma turkestanicum]|nr:unnamed protein product [Schistosoma turkestanicum]